MKKIIAMFLACSMIVGLIPVTAFAASKEAQSSADVLNALGLFSGTGIDENRKPIYDLDRASTRQEAVAMLVRLLGKGEEATSGDWQTPFTDVANWARPYVGYAYTNGLVSGTSATTFGGNDTVTAAQYITFVLRALGYESGVDFKWNSAWELSDELGITDGRYAEQEFFLRGDIAMISYYALSAENRDTKKKLFEQLRDAGVVVADAVETLPFRIYPVKASLKAKDKNGNILLHAWPYDKSVDLPMNFNYFDLVFNVNPIKANKEDIYLYNLETGKRVSIYSAAPGSTAKDAFIVTPNAMITSGVKYYFYIPAGVIEMENGTVYEQDICITFSRD